MRCDGTPDPVVHQDINTYMSLWRDDPEVGVQAVLKQCDLALKVNPNRLMKSTNGIKDELEQ